MQLNLAKIRRDGGTQPRAKLSEDTVSEYMEDMRAGDEFRPVTVFFDGDDYWLSDGFHRVEAKLRLDPNGTIEADVEQGTLEDAQWHSYSVNKKHGLRRTNADKKRAVRAAISHPGARNKSDRDIAQHVGVSKNTVAKYRSDLQSGGQIDHLTNEESGQSEQSDKRVGRDGKNYPSRKIQTVVPLEDLRKAARSTSLQPHQPKLVPAIMEKMTAINLPHNPVAGARALVEVFGVEYVRALIDEISKYLEGVQACAS